MSTLKLKRIGKRDWSGIVYVDEATEKHYADINHTDGMEATPTTLYALTGDFEEPDYPIKDFEIVNPYTEKELKQERFTHEYMMLGRIKDDVAAYLGKSGIVENDKWDCRYRNEAMIYGKNINEAMASLKEWWNKIPDDIKPEWLTAEQIQGFEIKLADLQKS